MRLEDIEVDSRLRGIVQSGTVRIVSVKWIGDQAINASYRDRDGALHEITLYRESERRLELDAEERSWSFDADGAQLRLVTEAHRIRLAHHFDPYLAIHTSLIEPLPHQISAVYGEMLPRQPLRFLLADDPGAGKTIMAGLLMKELIARGDLERCLIVAPGSLVEQWQDELGKKFALEFEMMETAGSGNKLAEHGRLIVRLDVLARNDALRERLLKSPEWDLIVCDEAHRMSASWSGREVKYTKRYRLGEKLGRICRHLLLMTATPHNGKEGDFQLFMALLDDDRFEGRFRDGVHRTDVADMMRRLTKEKLLHFDGRPLFPERRAYTVKYELSPGEAELYREVTDYVRTEMNRVQRFTGPDGKERDGKKKNNVGFALQILQRRLASSPAAIHRSLQRRRTRLEAELAEARRSAGGFSFDADEASDDFLHNVEEYGQQDVEEYEDRISARATMAETVQQLAMEVETLKRLETMACDLRHGGEDTKWRQLERILDDDLMRDGAGNRRKLIVFTEPKDTLSYLHDKVRDRLGRPEAVAVIHGGVRREERHGIIDRFMQDRDLLVLIANDAAGEGVNLQRGHLMVNYDLPWNPNRIEQRFGRIHRIGQKEVCHLWNIVAADTREGEVYARLLEKLDAARQALGGHVYDVLGELFKGDALKDLLIEAIRYGERAEVRERLLRQVDGAVDRDHMRDLLDRHALTNDTLSQAQVGELRLEMERAEAQRLQPYHVQSFFIEAFKRLGGSVEARERERWEIARVPARILKHSRDIGAPAQPKYERICFDKAKIDRQPVAEFICPGHPLLEAVIDIVCQEHGRLMQRGAVLVDDTDHDTRLSAVVLLQHDVRDGRSTGTGKPHVVSRKLQFAAVHDTGDDTGDDRDRVTDAGIAPHLDLRPADPGEIALTQDLLRRGWLTSDLERSVTEFATLELARRHVAEVEARRLPAIDKVAREVRARLNTEINHWDKRAAELREEEKAGRKTRLNWQNAQSRADALAERLQRRLAQLEAERLIVAQPPRMLGCMAVIPRGLLDMLERRRLGGRVPGGTTVPGFAEDSAKDPTARRRVETAAMAAVMAAERALGNRPVDRSADKVGYDIASFDPRADRSRFIEVKGRVESARTVMLTRQEVITSLHEPDKFILALVTVENGFANAPRYVHGPLVERRPSFPETAIQFDLKHLLQRAKEPA